jgi:eukaryotic-like serine/threonine-protein kinase
MSLAPSTQVGSYRVVGPLGKGGMGEVYRAVDTRLGRDVAIKILSAEFTGDADRVARFEREARVLASLSHPAIAAIYGIEEAAGLRALVLEFIDGGTLADRLAARAVSAGRALPIDEVLAIARQVASALDAAHERGIIHRDLKPANIGVTRSGTVKLLDFGLAKTESNLDRGPGIDVAADFHPSSLPTIAATIDGMVLGTVAYMSPEQARGQAVDKRTDIWAFGCVLFEALAGVPAFAAATVSDTIVNVLEREPNWAVLPPGVPRSVRHLLRRCLQKDAKRRLRDIGDAHDDLMGDDTNESPERTVRVQPVEFRRLTDRAGMNEWPAISPDGKMVAYVAVVNGHGQVWVQLLSGGVPLQITRYAADHSQPRWAPDSSTLVYHTSSDTPGEPGTLWEIPALGGAPRPIVGALGGGDVSHDGRRIALVAPHEGRVMVVTVARDGSDLRSVAPMPHSYIWRAPRWSFDDAWLAFQGWGASVWDERVYLVPAHGGQAQAVARASHLRGVAWLPDGSGLVYSSSRGSSQPYPPTFNLRRVDADGSRDIQLTFGDSSYLEPDVHSSGRVVTGRIRSESDIWKYPVGGSPLDNTRQAVRVTRQTGHVQVPSVSPDGSRIVYLSDIGGHANLWVARSDGSDAHQITFERDPAVTVGLPKWSPAGDWIVYVVKAEEPRLWLVRPDGRHAHKLVDRGTAAAWSPDGRWLYYVPEVAADIHCVEKISIDGGTPMVVRGDQNSHAPTVGHDVLYFAAGVTLRLGSWDWEIRRASPESGPSTLLGRVAGARFPVSPLHIHFALSPDGDSLAMGLADGVRTNIWTLGTSDGTWRQITDFGEEPTVIARQVSWSPDGQHLFAAVSKNHGDIVMLDGLV